VTLVERWPVTWGGGVWCLNVFGLHPLQGVAWHAGGKSHRDEHEDGQGAASPSARLKIDSAAGLRGLGRASKSSPKKAEGGLKKDTWSFLYAEQKRGEVVQRCGYAAS